jgi:hypothetical protein
MRLSTCQKCCSRLWTLYYVPRFCRMCCSPEVKSVRLGEWILLAAVAFFVVRYLV